MGELNAKIGVRGINDNRKYAAPFGSETGERLLDFAEETNLVISNSFFQKTPNRYWT